jgi:hypothetical protein
MDPFEFKRPLPRADGTNAIRSTRAPQRPNANMPKKPRINVTPPRMVEPRLETIEEQMLAEAMAFDAIAAELLPERRVQETMGKVEPNRRLESPKHAPSKIWNTTGRCVSTPESVVVEPEPDFAPEPKVVLSIPAQTVAVDPTTVVTVEPVNAVDPVKGVEPVKTVEASGRRSELIRRSILVSLLVLTSVMVVARLWTPAPQLATSASAAILADDFVSEVAATDGIASAVGSYIPGVGMVLQVDTEKVPREDIARWWSSIVAPMAPRFENVNPKDRLVATIVVRGSAPYSRVIVSSLVSLSDISSYRVATATSLEATGRVALVPEANAKIATAPLPPTAVPPTINAKAPNAPPAVVAAAAVASGDSTRPFATDDAEWKPMSGQWKAVGGHYQQMDPNGYDYITQRTGNAPESFSVSVKVSGPEGPANGGLTMFQTAIGKRNGATLVDLTDTNSYVRWGHFDEAGTYTFDGGTKLGVPVDPASGAIIKVDLQGGKATVYLDGKRLGEFVPNNQKGSFGLISSNAVVAFDDFTLVAVP